MPDIPLDPSIPVTKFETGAVRSADRAKVRYDLITPIGLRRVAETYHEGSQKYEAFNWEKGMPISDILNHAIPHIYAYLAGDRSEDHLAHAAWNLLAALHSEEMWPHLNQNLRGASGIPTCHFPEVVAKIAAAFSGSQAGVVHFVEPSQEGGIAPVGDESLAEAELPTATGRFDPKTGTYIVMENLKVGDPIYLNPPYITEAPNCEPTPKGDILEGNSPSPLHYIPLRKFPDCEVLYSQYPPDGITHYLKWYGDLPDPDLIWNNVSKDWIHPTDAECGYTPPAPATVTIGSPYIPPTDSPFRFDPQVSQLMGDLLYPSRPKPPTPNQIEDFLDKAPGLSDLPPYVFVNNPAFNPIEGIRAGWYSLAGRSYANHEFRGEIRWVGENGTVGDGDNAKNIRRMGHLNTPMYLGVHFEYLGTSFKKPVAPIKDSDSNNPSPQPERA